MNPGRGKTVRAAARTARRALYACGAFASAFLAAGALRLLPGWSGPVAGTWLRPAAILSALWLCTFAAALGMRALARGRSFAASAAFYILLAPAAFTAACALAAVLLSPDHLSCAAAFLAGRSMPVSFPREFATGAEFSFSQIASALSGECAPFADAPTWISARWNAFALDMSRSVARWRELLAASTLLLAGLHAAVSAALAAAVPSRNAKKAARRGALFLVPSAAGAAAALALAAPAGNPRIFEHIACKDSTYGGSSAVQAVDIEGREAAWCEDVPAGPDGDFKGRVLTIDGRPAIAGRRFFETRALLALLPAAEHAGGSPAWDAAAGSGAAAPVASVRLAALGADSFAFLDIWRELGFDPAFSPSLELPADGAADILFVSPEPDWIFGAERPGRGFWRRAKAALAPGGTCAYRIDARLMSAGRMKTLLSDFAEAFPSFRVWCAGPHDWLFTAAAGGAERTMRLANVAALFSAPRAAAIGIRCAGPAVEPGLLSAFVGSAQDVMPAFARFEGESALAASLAAPDTAFGANRGTAGAEISCAQLMPAERPSMAWCAYSAKDPEIPAALAAKADSFFEARRKAVMGDMKIEAGDEDAAYTMLAAAAAANPHDAVLRCRRDLMAIHCLQMLRKTATRDRMRALGTLENLAAIFPRDAAWQYNLGRHCLDFGGKADIAAQLFQRAADLADVKSNPEYREAHASTLFNAGQYELAAKAYLKLVKAFPRDPDRLMSLARALAARGNPSRNEKQALALAEKAVKFADDGGKTALRYADMLIEDCGRVKEGFEMKQALRAARQARTSPQKPPPPKPAAAFP